MTTISTPEGIRMVGLLQCRARLHLELVGLGFKGRSTLGTLKAAGVTTARTKWRALQDLNEYIRESGGPADTRSLALQRRLVEQAHEQGKPEPVYGRL